MSELAEKSKLLHERKLKSLLESERVRPIFGSAEAKFVSMKKWLAHRELPVERFSFVKAGFRENLTVEIGIVPAGALPPIATPTLTKITYRKGRLIKFCIDCCGP